MKMRNRNGPRTLSWGTLALTGTGDERITGRGDENILLRSHMLATRVEEVSNPCVELTLDAIGRQFGE